MHDSAQFEALGVPAVLIATEPMREIVESFGPTVGGADYAAVEVPHPVSPLDDDELQKLATAVADQVAAALTTMPG